jgi:hypothetical protein
VGISNSGENTSEERRPVEDEGEDAEASVLSKRGAFRAVAVACWVSERFKDRETEGKSGVPLDGSKCMRRRRLCRRTKARRIRESEWRVGSLSQNKLR